MIKRFDRLDVATSDLGDASVIYERNFGFAVRREAGTDDAIVNVGDAEIRLRAGADAASFIAANGEGLAAVWLEADNVDEVGAAFDLASLAHRPIRLEGDRRILEVDPKAANMVPLFIFDRRT
ncbi:MAG TPA: VOC family protein [Candidatus Binataceae bacterium]|nr:VOC family protein [Candidatus Binataceae bacterium]